MTATTSTILPGFLVGLGDHDEAYHTDASKPLEEQRADAMEWITSDRVTRILFILGNVCEDLSASMCLSWLRTPGNIDATKTLDDLPRIVTDRCFHEAHAILDELREEARAEALAARERDRDYRASVL